MAKANSTRTTSPKMGNPTAVNRDSAIAAARINPLIENPEVCVGLTLKFLSSIFTQVDRNNGITLSDADAPGISLILDACCAALEYQVSNEGGAA